MDTPLLNRSFQLAVDLLQPKISSERRRHKLKRLVQHPNSFFMDVKASVYYPDIMYVTMSHVPRSAPAVTGSPPSSPTRTPSWSAPAAPPCCVSPPGAGPSSQKASTRVTEQLSELIVLIPSRMCLPEKELIYISGDFYKVL